MKFGPDSLHNLVKALHALPGIGEKTAQRLAFHIVRSNPSYVDGLVSSLVEAKTRIKLCSNCFDLTEYDPCKICSNQKRDASLLAIVETPTDLRAIEASGGFHGHYHVLHGTISPLDGAGPENMRVKELVGRVEKQPPDEIILALNKNVEGCATVYYLLDELGRLPGVQQKMTQLGGDLPLGGSLTYASGEAIAHAFTHRIAIHSS